MKTKLMQLPRSVLVGEGVIEKTSDLCNDLKLEGKALVLSGQHTYKIAGERVLEIINNGYKANYSIVQEANMDEVKKVGAVINKDDIDFLVAVGGGKVIDVAKLASTHNDIEFISIPTAASHDGIASARASVKDDDSTVSVSARAPIGVIADTKIIRKAPYKLMASGCGDIIANYTAVKDWELARDVRGEEFSDYSSALSLMTAKIIMDSCDKIKDRSVESVRKVVKALISSGVAMSIAGSSRPASGSEHKFSHALDAIAPKPALHGEQCGIGTIIMMYLHEGDWQKIKDALKRIGAPTSSKELGIEDKYILKALVNARDIRPTRYTILNEVKLNEKDAIDVCRKCGVTR
ncbi:MAG: NAD(P)-dependent glycerol-1-phosphate dehydrogenase [Candidatus Hydrothermarchaeales archaeon]